MNNHPLRVVYAGTPEFAVPALRALADSKHQVVAVYTQPDRPAGRGRKLTAGPVKQAAQELAIEVQQPLSLREPDARQVLAAYQPDLMVVAAYGLILPQQVLDLPAHGCINVHASLLPRWRGAAPIQRAIAAGDTQSGITIMQMAAGLDTGDMLLKKACAIETNTTGSQLHDTLAVLGAEALMDVIGLIGTDGLQPEVQNEDLVTYAKKLSKQEALIDWQQSAVQIHRNICAFNGWPVAQTQLNGETLRIWQSRLISDSGGHNGRAGQVIDTTDGLDVGTGSGVLRITQVQMPGKKPVSSADFLRNRTIARGQQLG